MGLTDVTLDLGRLAVALRLADSAYPSGAFNSSFGLEGAIADGLVTNADDVERFTAMLLDHRFASFDRPMMRRAVCILTATDPLIDAGVVVDAEVTVATACSGQETLHGLAAVDQQIESWSIIDAARVASRRSGAALLSTAAALGDLRTARYRTMVLAGEAPGHQIIAQALVWSGEGLDAPICELMCGWQLVNQLASAALRLGTIGHLDGQRLRDIGLRRVVQLLGSEPPDEPSVFTPVADVAMATHCIRPTRMFAC